MPILTEKVEVIPTGKMIQYYKDKGYDAKRNQSLIINVEDLPNKSSVKIQYLCDYCHKEIMITRYVDYIDSIKEIGKMSCRNCSSQKVKEVLMIRYGVDSYSKTKEWRDKTEDTVKRKYGGFTLQSDELRKSYEKTCIERYGKSYKKQFVEKAFKTFYDKTGYNYPMQSPDVKEKFYNTNLEKYNTLNAMQNQEVKKRLNEALCKNGTQKTSKQQLYLHNLYGGELNYPISYYSCDICFSEEKLVIEYDGGGHNLCVTLGKLTQEEFNQKELIRDKVIKSEGYKIIRIQSKTDKLPSDTILLQMLDYARNYFSQYPNHSWINFSIDSSSILSAEYKEGIFFNYGQLRTIKDEEPKTA